MKRLPSSTRVGAEQLRTLRFALAACALALFATAADADIYKWIDENGATVITNVRPTKIPYARNFEVVQKDEPGQASRATRKPATAEQVLQERIDRLERELRAERAARQWTSTPTPAYAPPPPTVSYYTPYPEYYSPPYYPTLPVYSAGIYLPARPLVTHRFVVARSGFPHASFGHGSFGHHGRR